MAPFGAGNSLAWGRSPNPLSQGMRPQVSMQNRFVRKGSQPLLVATACNFKALNEVEKKQLLPHLGTSFSYFSVHLPFISYLSYFTELYLFNVTNI